MTSEHQKEGQIITFDWKIANIFAGSRIKNTVYPVQRGGRYSRNPCASTLPRETDLVLADEN